MSTWGRWLLPGILATVGVPFLVAGGVIRVTLPPMIAAHAQEVARLQVATFDTLNERGARVLLEGRVSPGTAPSDRPPLVAYNEYHRVRRDGELEWETARSYTPPLEVHIWGGEVDIREGYTVRTTASRVDETSDRYYAGFQVGDPVLVLGTLAVAGDRPVVGEAQIGYETKAEYLVALDREQSMTRWLGLLFLLLGSLLTLGAVVTAVLIWRGRLELLVDP